MAPQHRYPIDLVDAFIKEATESFKPIGVPDAGKSSMNRKRTSAGQLYSQPTPSTSTTQPSLVAAQKAVPPPPVT